MTNARLLLIFDLDETLIHATDAETVGAADFCVGPYHVFCRPHLNVFLEDCAERFDLAVWSSGSLDYVLAIRESIMPNGLQAEFIWGRKRCTRRFDAEWQEEYWIKDLKKVKRQGFDLDRVLIVEDTPKKVERHYGNAVYVSSYFGGTDDRELLHLSRYLHSIHDVPNVRRIEKRGWRVQSEGSE
jgi:RNA polymerase II subunit A small phosphatase-like protein